MSTDEPQPFRIQLTESEQAFFAKRGPLPKAWLESRRAPRSYHRSLSRARVMPVEETGAIAVCYLLTRDISATGLNLLHSDPLAIGQRLEVELREGGQRWLSVQWCRRLNDRCYAAGCVFIAAPIEPTAVS